MVLLNEVAELISTVAAVAHRPVPVANNCLSDEGSEVVGIVPAYTFDCDRNVGRRNSIVTHTNLRADEIWPSLLLGSYAGCNSSWWLAWQVSKVFLSELDQLVVGNTASANQNHTVSRVVCLDVVDEVVPLNALDVLLRSKDGSSEGLPLECDSVKMIEDNFLHLFVDLLLFPQDNVSLPFDCLRLELRMLKNIGKNVNSVGDVRVEGFGVVDGVLTLGLSQLNPWASAIFAHTDVYALRWPPMFSISNSN